MRNCPFLKQEGTQVYTKENLLVLLNQQFKSMSKSHKSIASYLKENYEKAAFLTAAEIAKEVGVSESTVVRFATSLGFAGFPQLHKALGDLLKTHFKTSKKIDILKEKSTRTDLIKAVLTSDIEKLQDTMEGMDMKALDIAVEDILQAETVYIIGLRNCAPLAEILHFYLHMICPHAVLLHSTSNSEIFEQMMRITHRDVIIGISFPRYSMRTLKAMEFANSRNAKIISITDSLYSPMSLYASCRLLAKSDLSSVVDSLVAPLSVINALVMALYMEKQEEVLTNIELVENLWEDYQIYSKDEINFVDPQKGTGLNE